MSRSLERHLDRRGWLLGLPIVFIILLLLRSALSPDAAAGHFFRAQRLQALGQEQQALRLYELIATTLPQSTYAPLALQQEGEIQTALARRTGEAELFRRAIKAYDQLANEYSSHSAAGSALMAAGSIALNDLRDTRLAAGYYNKLLTSYSNNAEYASEATLRLARIAVQQGAGAKAQQLFARVLKKYSRFPDRCAEAQYYQGVVWETLLKNKAGARAAYEATIKLWPRSVWASDAKERLGMMVYSDQDSTPPARRVLLEIAPLPPTEGSGIGTAVRLILAARGIEISDTVWRGWSLAPFRAGFAPDAPERVLQADGNWETVAANAGLVYSRRRARDASAALNLLRDELDAGRLPVVTAGGWQVVVGYDSSRDEIFTVARGAQQQTWKAGEFASKWRNAGEYSLLSFHAPGAQRQAISPKSQSTNVSDLTAPIYVFKLPRLSLREAHRRALRRAATVMQRTREGTMLLNLEALRTLKREVQRLAETSDSPVPAVDESTPDEAAPPPAATTNSISIAQAGARWKVLRRWFGGPLQHWINARRDAAAYLEIAGREAGDTRLQSAANDLRDAIDALQNATQTAPAENAFDGDLSAAKQALDATAQALQNALEAEQSATTAMS